MPQVRNSETSGLEHTRQVLNADSVFRGRLCGVAGALPGLRGPQPALCCQASARDLSL